MMVSPYFKLYGNLRAEGEEVVYSDGDDIMDGYIPTPEDEIWEYVSKRMEKTAGKSDVLAKKIVAIWEKV